MNYLDRVITMCINSLSRKRILFWGQFSVPNVIKVCFLRLERKWPFGSGHLHPGYQYEDVSPPGLSTVPMIITFTFLFLIILNSFIIFKWWLSFGYLSIQLFAMSPSWIRVQEGKSYRSSTPVLIQEIPVWSATMCSKESNKLWTPVSLVQTWSTPLIFKKDRGVGNPTRPISQSVKKFIRVIVN